MQIGLVIYGSLETISGGYLYDRTLVDYLRRQGDTVQVVSLPWRGYLRHLMDNFSLKLERRLQELPVQLWVQDELNHPSLFRLNRRLRRRHAPPLISIVHHLRSQELHPGWLKRFYRSVEVSYLRSVQGFIFNSQHTRQTVAREVSPLPPHVVALPGGDRFAPQIEPSEVQRRCREAGPLRLLFLGNVIPRKGLHTLLQAMKRLPAADYRLTVVGSLDFNPGYAHRIRQLTSQLGLQAQVTFRGALADAELPGLLRSHQALVVPSQLEGFGIVYLEAMGFGLPAIAGKEGAASEIITDGENGYLVPPEEVAALADRLQQLADRERLLALSLGALQRYRAGPTWEESCCRIRRFLQERLEADK